MRVTNNGVAHVSAMHSAAPRTNFLRVQRECVAELQNFTSVARHSLTLHLKNQSFVSSCLITLPFRKCTLISLYMIEINQSFVSSCLITLPFRKCPLISMYMIEIFVLKN
jgi:hypothetical protein